MIDPTSFENVPSLTYIFNSKSGHWNSPITKGIQPKRRNNMKAIVDDTEKIHIFSRYSNTESEIFYDDMLLCRISISISDVDSMSIRCRFDVNSISLIDVESTILT